MVPENTRTRLTLPTYGSDVVFTTSASSGPSGAQVKPLRATPCGGNTSGSGGSDGDGQPRVIPRRTPQGHHAGGPDRGVVAGGHQGLGPAAQLRPRAPLVDCEVVDRRLHREGEGVLEP